MMCNMKCFIHIKCVCTIKITAYRNIFIAKNFNLLLTYLNTSNGATIETIKSACTYPISMRDNENAQPKRSIKSSIIAK